MFTEFKCGCIQSYTQGRVRICENHRLEKATGDGGTVTGKMPKVIRQYPANGMQVAAWDGGKKQTGLDKSPLLVAILAMMGGSK